MALLFSFTIPKKEARVKKVSTSRSIDVYNPFEIEFDRPIDHTDNLTISIFKDSNKIELDSIKIKKNKLLIYFPKKEDESFKFELLPGAITDIFDTKTTDTLSGFITVKKSDYYGSFTLKLKPKNDSVNYLISILDENGNTVSSKTGKGNTELNFKKLPPGKYTIKAIEDLNTNEKWDTGDYYLNKKPEQVFYFPTQIEIRSNWELAESWRI